MTTIHIRYEGAFHCRARHAPSGRELLTDLPVDNGGRGEFFSPTDLVATALGSCMLTIMAKAAARRGVDLAGARARVVKRMATEGPRRIAALETVLELPDDLPPEIRPHLERAARTCPVHRTLAGNVTLTLTVRYGPRGES